MKFSCVIQGPVYEYTKDFIKHHQKYFDEVIFSTYDYCDLSGIDCKLVVNKDLDDPGIDNINRRIMTSKNGHRIANDNSIIVSMRSDIKINNPNLILNFLKSHMGLVNKDRIFVLGSSKTILFSHVINYMPVTQKL